MARIRTIKPEFCESESVGKLSREARLCFVLLWTIVDDAGRSRASSRFLASRLYPYDDDAADLIGRWLDELQRGGHVRLYTVDGDSYLDIPKWLNHQKIDHASKSRLPEFRETSREFAKPTETFAPHTLDLVPSTKDLGPRTVEGGALAPSPVLADAVSMFNAAAEHNHWPKVQHLSPARKTALNKCLRAVGGREGWQDLIAKASASDFLSGRSRRSDDHANWRLDFDFLLKKHVKIMEGGYDNSTRIPQQQSGIGAVLAALAD